MCMAASEIGCHCYRGYRYGIARRAARRVENPNDINHDIQQIVVA